MPEPCVTLFSYLGTAAFGGDQRLFCTNSRAFAGNAKSHRDARGHTLGGDQLTICDNSPDMTKPRPRTFGDGAAAVYVVVRFTRDN